MARWNAVPIWIGAAAASVAAACPAATAQGVPDMNETLYAYVIAEDGSPGSYDEAIAAATLQGLINRGGPRLYVLSATRNRPAQWLDTFSAGGRWLAGHERKRLDSLPALRELAGEALAGAVIWDPEVPATVNVATTIAGVKDAVVLSPEFADRYLDAWGLKVIEDLRGRFDGSETGSAKNDAYRWAIREYLEPGHVTSKLLCLYEDAHYARKDGNLAYVVTRDWAVYRRAFVFDLSPWGDEIPGDDPKQKLGTDLETYKMMLQATLDNAAGKHMTELAGFFAFLKYSNVPGHESAHEPVPTEWETVRLISPYNAYQNTVAHHCYNQSLHAQFPFEPLKQRRPPAREELERKTYVCILMADYDSATPLYDFMPAFWADPVRGELPLAWGINPNLIETYPDVISYYYDTATENDFFTADASAAGYMNPNRIASRFMPLFIEHNKRFFDLTDMSLAPMVLDWDEPTAEVKDAFTQFAPDGFATIVMDLHNEGGKPPEPHVWKGMPVMELINSACNFERPEVTAEQMRAEIIGRGNETPGFYFFRIVWTPPSKIKASIEEFKRRYPEIDIEITDPYNFFALFKRHQLAQQ